ncbi:MAG: radical SAM protein [Bacteroidia bacterium]|nr:radical SAM protein [Bacteroidia bacterium]
MLYVKDEKSLKKSLIPSFPSPFLPENAWEKKVLKGKVVQTFLKRSFQAVGSPLKVYKALKELNKRGAIANDYPAFQKVAKVDGRYYWRMGNPGYPSKAFQRVFDNELNRVAPFKKSSGLRTIVLAITKKCPLACEHCFEWNNLNKKETLSLSDLIKIVSDYQEHGNTQFLLSGGEPMVRVKDLYKLLEAVDTEASDFWIYSSGFGFTREHAFGLKERGLRGVLWSLDHHEEEKHDSFRGYPGAFQAVMDSIGYAKEAGLVPGFSVCVRPEYIEPEDIEQLMELARQLGMVFIRILEARPTGRYQGKAVSLSEEQIEQLKKLYFRYNTDPEYWDYPILDWLDHQQRLAGCYGGGNRYLYIDTDGAIHACPFCSRKAANTLKQSPEEVIEALESNSCSLFGKSLI